MGSVCSRRGGDSDLEFVCASSMGESRVPTLDRRRSEGRKRENKKGVFFHDSNVCRLVL